MKLLTKVEQYIVPDKPISQDAITEARFAYTERYNNNPFEIRVSTGAFISMCAELGVPAPVNLTNESVQGMLIKRDPSLNGEEWLVGSTNERITAIK